MKILKDILLVLVIAVLAVNAVLTYNQSQETKYLRDLVKEKYKHEISVLEESNVRSERERVLLNNRLDSLSSVNQTLLDRLKATNDELAKVKGRYKGHTPTELETEMMRRFNEGR